MLSVVLPCYNPPDGWDQNIIHNYNAIKQHIEDDIEVVLVNDGSNIAILDESIKLLKQNIENFTYVNNRTNKGKGAAVRTGVKSAKGNIIIYTDIDFPYTIYSFLKVYNAIANDKCDIAAGIKDSMYYKNVPFMRKLVSKVLRAMTRTLLSIPITDTQCGLKGFNKKAASIFLATSIDRYLFDIEFIRSAYKQSYTIKPIPVMLNGNVEFRRMNYKILIPEMANFLKIMFK